MNGLTDIFYDVVDSAVSKECKRLLVWSGMMQLAR